MSETMRVMFRVASRPARASLARPLAHCCTVWSRCAMEAPRGRPRTLALGVWLITRGALVRASLALTALGALGSIAAVIATRGTSTVQEVPVLASMAFTWGAGTTLAFGGALHALRSDRERGITALARARGVGTGLYARGRVGGLVAMLALAAGGGTLVAGLAATAAAGGAKYAVARASVAALVYALAFAATIGPLAMAALGGRSRSGGYLTLLTALVLPELVAPWTGALLPRGWRELTSIPAALEALRAGVQAAGPAVLHAARAAVALAVVVVTCLLLVHARLSIDALDDNGTGQR
jgi:hypothetical protein